MTLEELLMKEKDSTLLAIQKELNDAIVPATGYSHSYCRKVNRMIDAGKLCINPTTYRKVYLPTLSKAVHKELARRWTNVLVREKNAISPLEHLKCYLTSIVDVEGDMEFLDRLLERITEPLDELIEEAFEELDEEEA